MRGKVLRGSMIRRMSGITPAYAGKRQKSSIRISAYRDHPRLCGEKVQEDKLRYLIVGSPPPMRGKGTVKRFEFHFVRITPAYAGKRQKSSIRISAYRDHPRLCGEKAYLPTHSYTLPGSPPPMRGKGFQQNLQSAF